MRVGLPNTGSKCWVPHSSVLQLEWDAKHLMRHFLFINRTCKAAAGARASYHLDACARETGARNSQEAVFLIRVPVRLFLLERRRRRFSPQRVVPGNRLQSIMAGLKDHRRLSRFALNLVKLDGHLAARIGPMSKGSNGAFAKVLCYRSRSVRTEAYAERRPGGPGRVGGIGRFRTVDAGILRGGKRGSCDQRQYNRGAGYYNMQ